MAWLKEDGGTIVSEETAKKLGEALAFLCRDIDRHLRRMGPSEIDCVAVEESDLYSGLVEEFFPGVFTDKDYPEWEIFRKTLYDTARRIYPET